MVDHIEFNIMVLEWYKKLFNIALWQTLFQYHDQSDNNSYNITLHCNFFNVTMHHYKIRVYVIGFSIGLIILGFTMLGL